MQDYKEELITISKMLIDFYEHLIISYDGILLDDSGIIDLLYKLEVIEKMRPIRKDLNDIKHFYDSLITATEEDLKKLILPNVVLMWSIK